MEMAVSAAVSRPAMEQQLVSLIPELSMQADKVLDGYLSFTDFDRLDEEVNTDEAKERNQVGKELEQAIAPFVPPEFSFFNLSGLEKRLKEYFSFERRDLLKKVNLAMFIHYLFDGTVDDLIAIQACFRDSIYGSDASITSTYSNIWLELKTQAYIRQKESDTRATVESIFPPIEKDITHLFMGSKGGRASQSLIEARRRYMSRAEELRLSDLDHMLTQYPWPDFLRKMIQFTQGERKTLELNNVGNQSLETLEPFAAAAGVEDIAENYASASRRRTAQQANIDDGGTSNKRQRAMHASRNESQIGPSTTQIDRNSDQQSILAQTQRFFEAQRTRGHSPGSMIDRDAITTVDDTQIDDQLRALGDVDETPGHHTGQDDDGDDQGDSSIHAPGLSAEAMETLAHYPIPPEMDVRPRKERKKSRPWSDTETSVLIMMVTQMGPRWAAILEHDRRTGSHVFEGRDQVALKDKARNLKRKLMNAGEKLPAQWEGVTIDKRQSHKSHDD